MVNNDPNNIIKQIHRFNEKLISYF